MAKLITIFLEEPFQKRGLSFIGPIKLTSHYSNNRFILIATNYASGWRWELCAPTQLLLLQSFYMTTFSPNLVAHWLLLLIKVHFINDVICYLINHFILIHFSFTIYYLEGSRQAKSTNKVFGTLLTKLVNES
jgi:hypothetical protein